MPVHLRGIWEKRRPYIRPKRGSTGQGCSEMSRTSARHVMPVLPGRRPQGEIMPLWEPLKQVSQCKLLQWTYLGPYQKVSQEIHLFWLQVITSPNGWRPNPYTTKKQKLLQGSLSMRCSAGFPHLSSYTQTKGDNLSQV